MNPFARPFVPRNRNQTNPNIQPLTQLSRNQNQNQTVQNIQPSTQFSRNQNPIIVSNIQPSSQFSTQPYDVHNMSYRNMVYGQPSTQFIPQPYYKGVHNMPYLHLRPPPHATINNVQQPSIQSRIRDQIHYYFSNDNLSRDVHLREHMDEEGFVPVQFIATFPKFKELSDNSHFILDSLKDSSIVEVKGELIRSKNDWKRFLLSYELKTASRPDTNKE